MKSAGRAGEILFGAILVAVLLVPSVSFAQTFSRALSIGSEGKDVSALQQYLKDKGYFTYPTITGFYGSVTWKAVAAFQKANNLEQVGSVGPKTRVLLNSALDTAISTSTTSIPPLVAAGTTTPPMATTTCWAPFGLTCIPGTNMIQPFAPGNGYTPGFGGGGGSIAVTPSVPTPDTTSPSVAITSPSNGATVSGSSVTLSANASDNVAVTGVQFKIDGANIGPVITNAPYTTTWDSTGASAGSHTLQAIAKDSSGNYATSTLITAANGATYYMSAAGNDTTGDGTSGKPWASPNHAGINCGDTIVASAGTYSSANMSLTHSVNCPANNNVAWVKCATAFSCTLASGQVNVRASYWGVQGWVVTNSGGAGFATTPQSSGASLHHVAFANNIVNGAQTNGITAYPYNGNGTNGIDYFAAIGNLLYNAAQGSALCFAGLSYASPTNSDTAAGTHSYIAWNIAWGNTNPNPCDGAAPVDGEGIILDSLYYNSYTGAVAVENNLLLANGYAGFQVNSNGTAGSSAPVLLRNNTAYGNNQNSAEAGSQFGELLIATNTYGITATNNIAQSTVSTVNSWNVTGMEVQLNDSTPISVIDNNGLYAANSGKDILNWGSAYNCAPTHPGPLGPFSNSYNSGCTGNILGISPNFVGTTIPGAPSCTGQSTTLGCMSATTANFTAQNTAIAALGGFQTAAPTDANNSTPYLCNIYSALPAGLVPNRCDVIKVDNTAPVISSIASTTVTSTATVTWATNEPATSRIIYGLTTSYGSATSSASLLTAHTLNISGLTALTVYHYAVVSVDAQGNTTTSSDRTFTTTSSQPGDIVGNFTAWWSPAFAYTMAYAAGGGNIALLVDSATGLTTYTMTALPDGTANVAGAAASAACSSGCKIKTLYDQTGHGNDITQATLSAMPTMRFSCIGSLPCASFVAGNSQKLVTASNISSSLSQPFTVSEVSNDNTTGSSGAHVASSISSEVSVGSYFQTDFTIYAGNTNGYYASYTQNAWHAIQSNVQQSSAAFYVDGSTPAFVNSSTIGTAGITGKLQMGSNGFNNYATAYMGEAGVLSGSLSAGQNAALNSNQHTRWGF